LSGETLKLGIPIDLRGGFYDSYRALASFVVLLQILW